MAQSIWRHSSGMIDKPLTNLVSSTESDTSWSNFHFLSGIITKQHIFNLVICLDFCQSTSNHWGAWALPPSRATILISFPLELCLSKFWFLHGKLFPQDGVWTCLLLLSLSPYLEPIMDLPQDSLPRCEWRSKTPETSNAKLYHFEDCVFMGKAPSRPDPNWTSHLQKPWINETSGIF